MLGQQHQPRARNKPADNIGEWMETDGRRERPVDVPKPTSSQGTRSKKQPKGQPQAVRSGRERERKGRGLPGDGRDGSDDSDDGSSKKQSQGDVADDGNAFGNGNRLIRKPSTTAQSGAAVLPSEYRSFRIPDPGIRRTVEATPTTAILAMRKRNRVEGFRKRIRLSQQDFESPVDQDDVDLVYEASAQNLAMEEFKKEALYSTIMDDDEWEQEANAKHELGVQLIAEAEQIVCNHIKSIIEDKFTVTCNDCTPEQLPRPWCGTLLLPSNIKIKANVPLGAHIHSRLPFQVRLVEDGEDADLEVVQRLTDPKARVIEAMFLQQELYAKKHGASKGMKALVDTILRLVLDGISDSEARDSRLHLQDVLFNSRLADRLTPEYVSWMSGRCGLADFNRLLEEKGREDYRQRRDTAIAVFREDMLSKQIPWSQEFWTDLAQPAATEGQLGYFVRGNLSTSRRVKKVDWERMGWRQSGLLKHPHVRCWRYATFEDSPDRVFAVSIDDEVLGLGGREDSSHARSM